jgi:hypothetical protein
VPCLVCVAAIPEAMNAAAARPHSECGPAYEGRPGSYCPDDQLLTFLNALEPTSGRLSVA